MKVNVGGIDRVLRIAIGVVLIGLAVTGTSRLVGLAGRRPAGHRPHRLVPALRHAGLQYLQDPLIAAPAAAGAPLP